MPIKRPKGPPGRVVVVEHESQVLRGNPLGDPTKRAVSVWLPPQYDDARLADRRYPVLYDLVGFMGAGPSHTNWKAFGENLPERAARLVHERKMDPVIIVLPDCYTALGGNQYVNSSAIGRYADYLTGEIVPFVDAEFRTRPSRDHRGCFGKSSGGYGAIVHGMRYPKVWGAVADHSGDAYFDFVYRSDWPNTLNALAKFAKPRREVGPIDVVARSAATADGRDDGRIAAFLAALWKKRKLAGSDGHTLMNLCMAATYDPDPDAPNGFRVPFDLETGELIPARWKNWLANDPIHMAGRNAAALRSLRGIWIDCGWSDQYHIHYGSRILSKRLRELDIAHVYEEFDDTHSDIDYRMDASLPFLARALGSGSGSDG